MRTLIILLLLSLGARAEVTAVVCDVQGRVEVRQKQSWEAARLLATLPEGAELRLHEDGRARLAFVRAGARVVLTGPCRVRLEQAGVALLQGDPEAVATLAPEQRKGVPLPSTVNLDRMAGVRRGLFSLLNDPVLRTPQATLRWVSERAVDEVQITIENDQTFERLVRTSLPGDSDSLRVSLEPGATYLVEMIGVQEGVPQPAAQFKLRVLDEPAATALGQAETFCRGAHAADPEDLSPLSALLSLYLENEQYREALHLSKQMLKQRPGDDTLVRLEAQLELLVSRPDVRL